MIRREMRRYPHFSKKENGEMGKWALVIFEEIENEGEMNETRTLSYEIEYKGVTTPVSGDEELFDFHAATFMEMVDSGLFEFFPGKEPK